MFNCHVSSVVALRANFLFTSSQTANATKNSKMSKGASLARHRDEAWNDGLNKIERTART
jgi:hypothetical protein